MKKQRLNLVSYFGGKAMQLHWIIPHLPKGDFHFVDMMGFPVGWTDTSN